MHPLSPHSGLSRSRRILFLTLLHALCPAPAQISREEDLKAALLISFVQFTDWPISEDPITLGILNQPELMASAARLSQGKTVLGRPIQIRGIKNVSDLKQCQVVYFGALQGKRLDEFLFPAQELHLLTMGDSDKLLASGGIIHIFLEDGRFKFEVNLAALSQTHLSISSKLLRLGYTRRDARSPSAGRQRP